MIPILNIRTTGRSDKLWFYLRARAAGAYEAYTAVSETAAEILRYDSRASHQLNHIVDAAWNVHQALTAAGSALDDAVVEYWTDEEVRLSAAQGGAR